MEDEIARLRAQLAGLHGAARTRPLLDLGHRCADRYWRTGPGTPAALPYLNECIEALEEAHGYLPSGDQMHGQVGLLLGIQLTARRGAHNGPEADRDRAIPLLEEAVVVRQLPPVLVAMGRFTLGQQLLDRALRALPMPDQFLAGMGGMSSGMPVGLPGAMGGVGLGMSGSGGLGGMAGATPSASIADVEQAQDCFRAVVAESPVPEMVRFAETMLVVAEALAALLGGFGGGPFGFDLGKMAQTVSALQGLQQGGAGLGGGFGAGIGPNGIAWGMSPEDYAQHFALIRPEQRPVAVSFGQDPARGGKSAASADSSEQVLPAAPPTADVAALRESTRNLLPDGIDLFASITALLQEPDPPEHLDELVALASTVVSCGEAPSGLDRLVLAAALYVRGLRDDGGWGDEDQDAPAEGDVQAAAVSLLAAAETLPGLQLESIPVVVFLATLLPDRTLAGVAEHLSPLTKLLRDVGADAAILPEPVASLWWNAVDGRLENAGTIGPSGGPKRIVVVGDAPPSSVSDAIVSCVASLGQLAVLARREDVPAVASGDAVFVVNPRGDRQAATVPAMLLRRTFYPGSVGLGSLIEDVGGRGTAEQVRARLGASLLHLDCGVTPEGALELADGTELSLQGVMEGGGGLAILPPGCFLPLADRLVEAGFSGVVGWGRDVAEEVAAVLVYVLHSELADGARTPAEAVREVRRWIAAPDPSVLPTLLAGHAERLANLSADAGPVMIYRGR